MVDSHLGTGSKIGLVLRAKFEQVKRERIGIEQRWLADLRQYKGVYDAIDESRMHPKRSKTFVRLTRIKTKTVDARLMDMLFPSGSEDNWEIKPTPSPDYIPDPRQWEAFVQSLGHVPTPDDAKHFIHGKVKEAATNMTREIRDQLAAVRYRKILKDVIHSGNLFGTGILKGPLVERRNHPRWKLMPDGQWGLSDKPEFRPFIEFAPIWSIFPDTGAHSFESSRFVFQRHVLARHELIELAQRQDFDAEAIRRHLASNPKGDVVPMNFETMLRLMGQDYRTVNPVEKRYEVAEYWGAVGPEDLDGTGVELPQNADEVWANVWLIGNEPIKVVLSPIEGVELPYYAYYYDKDETSIFGEGIPSIMRDDQKGLNASARAMMDNAAISAGPQIEVNVDLLAPGEDPRDVHPFRVWLREGTGVDSQYPAVRVTNLPSYTAEFLQLAEYFTNNVNESTVPSFLHGQPSSGVGRTVGGLSLLMGASQTSLKDQMATLDEEIVKPFIQAMYHWNMQFNDKAEVKGDFEIKVRGSSSLVAKEVRAQNLEAFAQSTVNDLDAQFVDREELLRQRIKVQELGDGIVKDPQEVKQDQQASQQDASNQQQQDQQAEMALEQQKLQAEMALEQQKLQAEMALEQQKAQVEFELAKQKQDAEIELARQKVEAELMFGQQKQTQNLELARQKQEPETGESIQHERGETRSIESSEDQSGKDNEGTRHERGENMAAERQEG